jgi:hypothetical protein
MPEDNDAQKDDVTPEEDRSSSSAEHASAKHERLAPSKKVEDSASENESEASDNTSASIAADTSHESTDELANTEPSGPAGGMITPKQGAHQSVWQWFTSHKKISVSALIVVVLAALAAIPVTRYAAAGLFLKQDFAVSVVDSQTGKPVTSATVTLHGKTAHTNNVGVATLRVAVGNATLSVSKQYYKANKASVLVPLGKPKGMYKLPLTATGRQVPITVLNKITGKAAENVTVTVAGTEAKTGKNGQAILVLPAGVATLKATLTGSGYNQASASVKVTTGTDPANTFQITPSGKLYFLSNASGKLDVIKSDLDGQNRQTVLPGTGTEDKNSTVLLASRDWKYAALLSKRDGGDNAKLFLIDTSNDQLTTMDEGNATFAPQGWSGHRFVYTVARNNIPDGQSKRQALKSYDAEAGKITVLDETNATSNAVGTNNEFYNDVYIQDKTVVYTKGWSATGYGTSADKQATIDSVQADGTQKKVLKGYPILGEYYYALETRPADFGEIYISYQVAHSNHHDAYEDGKVTASNLTDDQYFNDTYFTYIVSPSGNKTLWTDFRDGKNVFFVGDANGQNGKEIGSSTDTYASYGWYTDDYVLITKSSSELHILPASGLSGGLSAALKVTDYYKPNYLIRGYGYGYGG